MAILVAGGIYIKETGEIAGGHLISALVATYTDSDVYIHTNFSSEETQRTSKLKEKLRLTGVNHTGAQTVSAPYGYLTEDSFVGHSNVLETFKQKSKYLQTIDKIIVTTDIGERDFRYILNFGRLHNIETIVITCGEYEPKNSHNQVEIIELETSGQPNYDAHINTIKSVLQERGIIQNTPVQDRKIPDSRLKKMSKFFMQIIILSAAVILLFVGGLKLIDYISIDGETFEANIDWQQTVQHEECSTIETCMETGDAYLADLREYVNLQDEPHIFFENRTRTTYMNYEIENFEITDGETVKPLPFGNEAEFTEMWDVFAYVFPERYIANINEYRLFSDGEGNTGAYVSIMRDGTTLAMDIRDNRHKATQYRNLIHEFGHIYSLPIEDFEETCPSTDISCAKDGTIIADHADRFWSQYNEEWYENSDKSQYELEAFYNNNITDFYVPYQATNVKEDYAITFMKFITEKIPANSSQLRDVKVQSMYEDSELVALRVDILKSFVQYEKERTS